MPAAGREGDGASAENQPAEAAQFDGADGEARDSSRFDDEAVLSYGSGREDGDDSDQQLPAEGQTLREYLIWQLSLTNLSERDQHIVTLFIDSLDDDGYLKQDLAELLALLPAELEIEADDLNIALKHLQNLDPPGVGARSLAECLKMQLEALP